MLGAGLEVLEIRTYCTFAPFVALLGEPIASIADRFERSVDLPFGNLLVALAQRRVART